MNGSGGAALSAVVALVAVIARLVWSLDRAERRQVARARRLGRPTPQPVMPRWTAPRPRTPAPNRPVAEQEDARGVEVPQRLFVAAARAVAATLYASDTLLQRTLRVDHETAARLTLALEGAGIIGPATDGRHEVLVTVTGLPAVFARFGILEDAVPPGFE